MIRKFSKKGVSIFIVALIMFFLLGSLTIAVHEITNRIDFREYAGKDAAVLTRLQRITESHIFFIETVAEDYFKNKASDYEEAIKGVKFELENTTKQKYEMQKNLFLKNLEQKFNNYYKQKAETYNNYIQDNIRKRDGYFLDKNIDFKLYSYKDKLKGIALKKQIISSWKKSGGYLHYFPHFSINMPELKMLKNIEKIKKERVKLEKCLIEQDNFDNCRKKSDLDIQGDYNNKIADLEINIDGFIYLIEFKV
ncbi:MAG: hypothetical protein ACQER9_00100 [Nanobdellota archaeon]